MTLPRDTMGRIVALAEWRPTDYDGAIQQVAMVAAAWERASPSQRARLRIAAAGEAGLIQRRKSRVTRTTVAVYGAAAQGIETDPECKYAVVCEDHGTCVCVKTLSQARDTAPDPTNFCDDCRAAEELAPSRVQGA